MKVYQYQCEQSESTSNDFLRSISNLLLRSKFLKRLFGPGFSSDNSGDGPSQLGASTSAPRSRSQSANVGVLLNLTNSNTRRSSRLNSSNSQSSIDLAVSNILSASVPNGDAPIVQHLPINLINNSESPVSQGLRDSQPPLPQQQQLPDHDNQKLIDLDFNDFGVLISIVNSMAFIPEKFVKKVRSLYIKLMKKICDHPNDVLLWKKYFLLPTVLFTVQKGNRKEELGQRIILVENDDWSKFTIGYFQKRNIYVANKNPKVLKENQEKFTEKRINDLATAGEIGEIMKFISRDGSGPTNSTRTYDLLQAKHPGKNVNAIISAEDKIAINICQPVESSRNVLKINGNLVRKIIMKRQKLKKHGVSKERFDHLQALIGYGGENREDEEKFAELYANIVVLILDDKIPPQVWELLRNNEICGPPKGEDDIRPIGMGECLRKVASICFLVSTNDVPVPDDNENVPEICFNKSHFKNLQYGMHSNGCEIIIHQVRASLEKYPERDHFFADAEMAFQKVSRVSGLNEVRKHFPIIMPFLRQIYGHDSKGWFFNLQKVLPIASQEGFHQGDVLASWLYAMTTLPFIIGLHQILGDNGFVKFFYDDGNISGSFETMCDAMRYIRDEGPKHGYFLQLNKGAYLLGQCGQDVAIERKNILITQFNLNPNSILIHPHDGGDENIYGAKVLGSFVGTDAFIQSNLQLKLSKLEKSAKNIIDKVKSKQIQFLLLRWCFSQKIIYWQRTIPARIVNNIFIPAFEALKKSILISILNIGEIEDKIWFLSCENLSSGGLGLHHSQQNSHAAYVASIIDCIDEIKIFLGDFLESNISMVTDFNNSIDFIKSQSSPDQDISFEKLVEIIPKHRKQNETLQHLISEFFQFSNKKKVSELFTTPEEVSWLESKKDPDSGLWLDIAPKTNMHKVNNSEFEILLSMRLRIPLKVIAPGTRCSCSRRKIITADCFGNHFCTGCGDDGVRIETHDFVRDRIATILNYCGIFTTTEPKNLFRSTDPEDGKRVDISALNLPGKTVKQLLDVRITSCIPSINPESLTIAKAKIPLRAANKSFDEKMRKYEQAATAIGLGFIPIVFETTGRMHPVTRSLLVDVIQRAAKERGAPFPAVWKYWISSLMLGLQIKLAEGILERCRNIYGRMFEETFESNHDVIVEMDYIRI